MGLKYIEPIKTAVLILLILLSITLTFSIWTFRPNYQPIEQAPAVEVSIAEKLKLSDVILPYKLISSSGDRMTGTTDRENIKTMVDFMSTWSFRNLQEADPEVTIDEVDSIVNHPESMTLFFRSPIPFGVADNLFRFSEPVTNEASFSRIVIETDSDRGLVHFIGREGGRRFTAQASEIDEERLKSLTAGAEAFEPYAAVERDEALNLYVPAESKPVSNLAFVQQEVSPARFKDALFPDPSLVQRERSGEHSESYYDIERQMNVDTQLRTLSFTDTKAESQGVSIPSELLLDSLDYVNGHSGWTNDFVLSSMDPIRKLIKYRLIVDGYPVFSDNPTTSTDITQVWGDGRIVRYTRPYYQLVDLVPEETEKILLSGTDVVEELRAEDSVDFAEVGEIARGYDLRRDDENNLYTLEPAWFYEENGEWQSVKKAGTGGGMGGLE